MAQVSAVDFFFLFLFRAYYSFSWQFFNFSNHKNYGRSGRISLNKIIKIFNHILLLIIQSLFQSEHRSVLIDIFISKRT